MAELFTNYTYFSVLLGIAVIGAGSATIGCFIYLRRQGSLGDVVAHSAFPGTMLAFLAGFLILDHGRSLTMFTVFAVITGVIGAITTNYIDRQTPLGAETGMAATITLFFSVGMLLLALIQRSELPGKGGLDDYLFGDVSHLTRNDLILGIAVTAVVVGLISVNFSKLELAIFDPEFGRASGLNIKAYEKLIFALLAAMIVVGMRTIGLLLIAGFIALPSAAARQWCSSLRSTVLLAAFFGSGSAVFASYITIKLWHAPTGAVTVLLLAAVFIVSITFAPGRGLIYKYLRKPGVVQSVADSHKQEVL